MKSFISQGGIAVAVGAIALGLFAITDLPGANPFPVESLPTPRNLHGSVVVGDYLFMISGDEPMPSGFTNSVLTARIHPDRTISPFVPNRPLPVNLIYIGNNVMVVRDHLYIVGGQEVRDIPNATNPGSEYEKAPNNSAIYARVDQAGLLGEWRRSTVWPGITGEGVAAATDGRFLYAIGGIEDETGMPKSAKGPLSDQVFFAPILVDGTVGGWRPTTPLPQPLWSHNAFFHNGNIYTLGGLSGHSMDTVIADVFVSRVMDDGSLDEWRVSPSRLAYPVQTASACAADDFLFLFCGRGEGGRMVEKIQFASLTAEGLSEWRAVDTRITARWYSSAALDPVRRSVYISGGRFSTNYRDLNEKVFAFPLRAASTTTTSQIAAASRNVFRSHIDAMAEARDNGKRAFIFVYSNEIAFSREALLSLSSTPSFTSPAAEKAVLGMIDASAFPHIMRNLGLIRVPSYVLFDANGEVLNKASGIKSPQELVAFIGA